MIKDPSPIVRSAVAQHGYGIKTLIKDSDETVKRIAKLYGFQHKDAIGEWKIIRKIRSCSVCGYQESKYKVATKRCPDCNFIMSNFETLPSFKKPKEKIRKN